MSARSAGNGALAFMFITVLVDSIGFGIILPVLPRLIMQLTGVTIDRAAAYGGWLSFVYALMQFFCAPVLGNLSDHFGRRPVLLFALLALGCDYFIMGLAPVIGWLFVGRAIAGVAGASFTPAYAYVADISRAERARPDLRPHGRGVRHRLHRRARPIGGLLGGFGPRAPFFTAGTHRARQRDVRLLRAARVAAARSRGGHFTGRAPTRSARCCRCASYPVVRWLLGALFLWQLAHQVLPSTWAFYTISKFHWTSAQVG